jgi:hypothetical protein
LGALTVGALCAGLLLSITCCNGTPRTGNRENPSDDPDDPMVLMERFDNDSAFRRRALEESLENRNNSYARIRLDRYNDRDWGQLPVAAFRSRPVVPADLGHPPPVPDDSWTSMPSDGALLTPGELRQRGEEMFNRFPAQLERSMLPLIRKSDAISRYGFWQTASSVGGLVWVELPGGVMPAFTCSTCHSSMGEDGRLRPGVPGHRIDTGRARDDYAGVRSLYSTWGPGRVDLAADASDNPVVIADVRAVRFQQYLHRTANVRNSLTALALRVETGLITAHRSAVRPARRNAFALAYYLWSLGADLNPARRDPGHPGRQVFENHCASCHQGDSLAGPPVSAASIDSPVADMPRTVRVTGNLQGISLRGVSDRRLLLYGGDVHSFDELLSPERTTGGHYFGKSLSNAEGAALKKYLETL